MNKKDIKEERELNDKVIYPFVKYILFFKI